MPQDGFNFSRQKFHSPPQKGSRHPAVGTGVNLARCASLVPVARATGLCGLDIESTPRFIRAEGSDTPFAPLSANRVGSPTKAILREWGIPQQFGPHSTRGAGVFLYKSWGLSSEHVCEVGRWKDHQAFRSHYLRLRATETVAGPIRDRLGVQKV